jgi:hypothetical protein
MLVVGPNLLVGGPAGLISFFVPTIADLRDPTSLLQRLTAARLAYPSQMRCVLWLVTEVSHGVQDPQFFTHFQLVVRGQRRVDLGDVLRRDMSTETRHVPAEIQQRAYLRAHALIHETERRTRHVAQSADREWLESLPS